MHGTYVVTRMMPIGGSWQNPRYEMQSFTVGASCRMTAAKEADGVQDWAKRNKWGVKPEVNIGVGSGVDKSKRNREA